MHYFNVVFLSAHLSEQSSDHNNDKDIMSSNETASREELSEFTH